MRQLCLFQVAGRQYAIDILHIKEITDDHRIESIYHAPQEVRGYLNVRGQIHVILDMGIALGCPAIPMGPESRILLMKSSVGESFGLCVEKVLRVVAVEDESILDDNSMVKSDDGARATTGFAGICKLEKDLALYIDPSALAAKWAT